MFALVANNRAKAPNITSVSLSAGTSETLTTAISNAATYAGVNIRDNRVVIMTGQGNASVRVLLVEESGGTPNVLHERTLGTYATPAVSPRLAYMAYDRDNDIIFACHVGLTNSGANDHFIRVWTITESSDLLTERQTTTSQPDQSTSIVKSCHCTYIGESGGKSYFATTVALDTSTSHYYAIQVWEVDQSVYTITRKDTFLSASQTTSYIESENTYLPVITEAQWDINVCMEGGRTYYHTYNQGTDTISSATTQDTFTNSDQPVLLRNRKNSTLNTFGRAALVTVSSDSTTTDGNGWIEFGGASGKEGESVLAWSGNARGTWYQIFGELDFGYLSNETTEIVIAAVQEYGAGSQIDVNLYVSTLDGDGDLGSATDSLNISDIDHVHSQIVYLSPGKALLYYRQDGGSEYCTGRIITITHT